MANPLVVCSNCGAKNRIPMEKKHLQAKCGRCGNSLDNGVLTGVVMDLDDDGFRDLVSTTTLPVLVDFYSPTCGPCQMVAPMVVNIAEKFAGRAVVAKVDTSRHRSVAAQLQIRGVPTLVFYKNGSEMDRQVGASSQGEIERRLENIT